MSNRFNRLHGSALSPCAFAAPLLIASAAFSAGKIVITEIMYNPASEEKRGEAEWVEIANVGDAIVNLDGWHFDDEDRGTWGDFSPTLKLGPGEVAVIINAAKLDEAKFRAAWDASSGAGDKPKLDYKIVAVKWGGLANTPAEGDEVLQLLDGNENVICEVNYRISGDWPRADGASIWLHDLKATDLNNGKLWRLSQEGDGASRACAAGEVFNKPDVGSPGIVPGLNAPEANGVLAKPEETVDPVKDPEKPAKPAKPATKPKDDGIPY
jgi:hypothetical protein